MGINCAIVLIATGQHARSSDLNLFRVYAGNYKHVRFHVFGLFARDSSEEDNRLREFEEQRLPIGGLAPDPRIGQYISITSP